MMKPGVTRKPPMSSHTRLRWWLPGAAAAASVAALIGWQAAGRAHASVDVRQRAVLAKIVHAGGEPGTGVVAVSRDGKRQDVGEGWRVPWGTRLETGAGTRARLELQDGTTVAVDRTTSIVLDGAHALALPTGAIVAEVATGAPLVVATPLGEVRGSDARFALTADDARTSLGVARGDVDVTGSRDRATLHAGEEGDLARDGARVEITPTTDLAQRMAFGEGFAANGGDDDVASAGLGTLRARKPGDKDEIDGAVRLAKHAVTARIVGAMARTEVDETFVNTTDQDLEGVWRFPLPAGARLERLALEVDGKLVEGEFVDASRAAGIWRGVIQHAAPSSPKPVEEIVWVPGPWRDPALLEWQRGGAAELKIFPIPRKGSRRVVLAYTQHIAPTGALRRYVYPLAARPGQAPVEEVSFDVQVLGADPAVGVKARGYELAPREGAPRAAHLSMTRTAFAPSGDLQIEYATADRTSDVTAFAFAPAGSTEDGFVTLALRPRWPARIAERGRDQVLVVDAGRAMFGERLRRATRLAVTIAQQMDRRDRVAVMACDLACRVMPGGFRAPGAAAAHDVDAFLAGIEADGASDLVGAVRSAAAAPGRDAGHDLRVVLLSDGVASAGYRSPSRVSTEVTDALPDARSEVVTVPIGSDADVETLGEIAQGGGGAVVPYAPGQDLDAAALEVLSATYGAALRDVELTLPDGLRDMAPSKLATIRAGGEALVAARVHGDRVAGDVVLRGKVAGESFEARWPVDVYATRDDGNAWTARTWASLRVADDERAGNETSRAEAVALSHRFRVPSRLTSLLVLESEAMFQAFGVSRAEHAFEWTGETAAQASEVAATDDALTDSPANKEEPVDLGALAALGHGAGAGGLAGPAERPAPKPMRALSDNRAAAPPAADAAVAPPPSATIAPSTMTGAPILSKSPPPLPMGGEGRGGVGRWLRRVWFRTSLVAADDRSAVDVAKVDAARAALAASPDARQRHADLARLLVRQGNVDEVEAFASKWAERDPLDVDALTLRATARAWRGDRDGALRVLSGTLASPSMAPAAQSDVASSLARAEDRAGRAAEACALRVAAAEGKGSETALVASAMACERAQARTSSADRWLASAKDDMVRTRLSAAAAKFASGSALADPVFGDVVVDATWDPSAGADLDVAIVDPSGRRLSWASAARNVRASDCTSAAHEAIAVSSSATGRFVIEIVRANASATDHPVSGRLHVSSLGQTQVVPFVLVGSRARVARVEVRMDSRLEPVATGRAVGSCTPPFFTDATGLRRMKPGCQ